MTEAKQVISINYSAIVAPVRIAICGMDITVSADGIKIALADMERDAGPALTQDVVTGLFYPVSPLQSALP